MEWFEELVSYLDFYVAFNFAAAGGAHPELLVMWMMLQALAGSCIGALWIAEGVTIALGIIKTAKTIKSKVELMQTLKGTA